MASGGNILVSSDGVTLPHNLEELKPKRENDHDKFRSFINFNELDSEMKTGTLHGLNKYITNNFKSWKDKKLIVGVAGNTGAGKSSLVNTLRGLGPQDKEAAPVGNTETTTNVQEYSYPGNDRIVLKDFPGVGSQIFLRANYLEKTKLLDSNVVIVVSSGRFTENDSWIAKRVIEKQRNVLFVRTKVDLDVDSSKHDHPDEFDEYSCLSKIKEVMVKEIEQSEMNLQNVRGVVYLVSSRNTKYDFGKLARTLKVLLDREDNAICQLLYEHMQKSIESKTRDTETEFLEKKVASVVVGFLPIPMIETSLDQYNVGKIIKECQKIYGIDEESLKKLALELNISVMDLKTRMELNKLGDGEELHSKTEDKKWGFLEKYSKYVVPIAGSFFSAYKSPCTMQECLEKICQVMAADALMLVRLRLEKLRKDLTLLQE